MGSGKNGGLFVRLAGLVRPSFDPTPHNDTAGNQI